MRGKTKRILKILLLALVIIIGVGGTVYYALNAGTPISHIPRTFLEREIIGIKFNDDFTANLVTDRPPVYFYWGGGDLIEPPREYPSRSTEFRYSVVAGGEVEAVEVTDISGDSELDRKVRDAIETWRYNPFATGQMQIEINWIANVVEVDVSKLTFTDPEAEHKTPLTGFDGRFWERIKGQPRFKP